MIKIGHEFCDSNICSATEDENRINIVFNDYTTVTHFSNFDIEVLAKAMGKRLVDDIGVHDIEEYYKD